MIFRTRHRDIVLLVAKLALALCGALAIWTLRSYPWWFVGYSALSVTVIAVDAVRTFRRSENRKQQ